MLNHDEKGHIILHIRYCVDQYRHCPNDTIIDQLYHYLIDKKIIKEDKIKNSKKIVNIVAEFLSTWFSFDQKVNEEEYYLPPQYDEYIQYYNNQILKAASNTKSDYRLDCSDLSASVKLSYHTGSATLPKLFYKLFDYGYISAEHYFYVIAIVEFYFQYFYIPK